MAPQTFGPITIDGNSSDWTAADRLGVTVTSQAAMSYIGVGDFDASGSSDVAWASDGGGHATLWMGKNGALTQSAVPNAAMGAEWTAYGVGDFNGDGKSDLLWTNNAGQVAVWELNGPNLIGFGVPAGKMGAEWHVAAIGDFNGDGKSDLLWVNTSGQAAVWTMDGTALAGFAVSNGAMGAEWSVLGTGDFNQDGRADVLWENTSGNVDIWEMNGANLSGFVQNVGTAPGHFAGIGHFSGSAGNTSDVVWVDSTNHVTIWQMNNGHIANTVRLNGLDGLEWHLKGVGSFAGDANTDLLWISNSGALHVWEVNGPNVTELSVNAPTAQYSLYGHFDGTTYTFSLQAPAGIQIGSGTTIWLNTDLNPTTGYKVFGVSAGIEYDVKFDAAGKPSLYSVNATTAAETLVNGALVYAYSADKSFVELAIPGTSLGTTVPPSVGVLADVNNSTFLPSNFSNPEYVVTNSAAPPPKFGPITIDGNSSDWTPADRLDLPGTGTAGYALYGHFDGITYTFAFQAPTGVQIGSGTTIWLDTDLNPTTGYKVFGVSAGIEYDVKFDANGRPSLYSVNATTGAETFVSGQLPYAYSADKSFVELAIPGTSLGTTVPPNVGVLADVNNSAFLPGSFAGPDYILKNSAAPPPKFGPITIDGNSSDWTTADRLNLPGTGTAGYALYGHFDGITYTFAFQAPTGVQIGSGTTIWLDTDLNPTTGYKVFGVSAGVEYDVKFDANGRPSLYSVNATTGAETFVSGQLPYAYSADKSFVELAIPGTSLGTTVPPNVGVLADVNNSAFLPGSFAGPDYILKNSAAPPPKFGPITIDGNSSDWTPADRLDLPGTGTAGYALYGHFDGITYTFAFQAPTGVQIGSGTTIWLDTDLNPTTGYKVFGLSAGVEYDVKFDANGRPSLYSVNATTGAETFVSGQLPYAYSADKSFVELAIPGTSLGTTVPPNVGVLADVNNSAFLPGSFAGPDYILKNSAAPPPKFGPITIDGNSSDWTPADRLDLPGTGTAGYALYGHFDGITYTFAFQAPTGVQIGSGTTIWLDTYLNPTTGYKVFGLSAGVEYDVKFDANGRPSLYSVNATTGAETFVSGQLPYAYSADKSFVELAIPGTSLGTTIPPSVGILADVNNSTFLPGNFSNPEYVVVNSATLPARTSPAHKIAIVYSDTTAALFFGNADHSVNQKGYSELFMAAQYQAMQAGVPFNVISEADLKDMSKIAQYDALVFPSFRDVNTADLATIQENLILASQKYHIGLIAAGDFMTNDQNGAALAGDPYLRMKELLDINRSGGGTANIDLAANTGSPIMKGYAANEDIHSYSNIGYNYYATADGAQPTVLANEVIGGTVTSGIVSGGTPFNAVLQTHTGGTNVHFASESYLGDNNILGQAIKNVVYGSGFSVSLKESRFNLIVGSRTDMDQSQYTDDVSPTPGPGIYAKLLPILQQWKAQYNFVGSYYINIGDTPAAGRTTNWAVSLPIYQALIAMGNEIGDHSYTHLAALAAEDTALLSLTGTGPGTVDYEFNQSKQIINQQIGSVVPGYADLGAAVPGAPEALAMSQAIEQYFGYVTGGYTGIGAGYPGGFGFLTPGNQNSVYIAPDITFDFTQIEFLKKTFAQADAAWAAEFSALTNHASTPIVVWPWHDYGATNLFNNGYDLSMYTDMIARAATAGAEFVTLGDLASRINNFHNASITTSVSGNSITTAVTPGTGGDVGTFGLDINFTAAGQVIQSVNNWYAYNDHTVFLSKSGGTFVVNVGTTQDDVTHISALAMRADLQSLQGDGTNLTFSEFGDGSDIITLKTPGTNAVVVQGADAASLSGNSLTLSFNNAQQHDMSIHEVPTGIVPAPSIFNAALPINAIMFGGAANDTFAFTKGFGKDIISDYHPGDAIQFSSNVFTTFDQVKAAMTQAPDASVPNHADVTITAGTDTVTLKNYLLASLQANDFKFVA